MSFYQTIFFFFILAFIHLSEASPEKKLPSAVVVGTVYCDTCFQDDFSKSGHFISGASVAVECKDGSFRKEVKTDSHGEFKVHLPFSISKHVKKIEGCSVKLISSSEPYCAVASTATSSSLHLKSKKQGIHIFSAGFFTFKPLKQPILCNQKPSIENSKGQTFKKEDLTPVDELPFPPPIQDPTLPGLPPFQYLPPLPGLPQLPPLPTLPPLPPLPGIPRFSPSPGKVATGSKPTESSKKAQLVADKKVAHPEFFLPTPQVPLLPPNPQVPFQYLPPLPRLPQLPPLPTLTPLPPLPGIPRFPPSPGKVATGSKPTESSKKAQLVADKKVAHPEFFLPTPQVPLLPPNPFQPPSIFPPNPFQPPSIFPPNPFRPPPLIPNPFQPLPLLPNPFQPPPAPLLPFPPIPGLTPSPPPPSVPFPFPPLIPNPPTTPPIPGTPPASSPSSSKHNP